MTGEARCWNDLAKEIERLTKERVRTLAAMKKMDAALTDHWGASSGHFAQRNMPSNWRSARDDLCAAIEAAEGAAP